jgi:hypothetical protein
VSKKLGKTVTPRKTGAVFTSCDRSYKNYLWRLMHHSLEHSIETCLYIFTCPTWGVKKVSFIFVHFLSTYSPHQQNIFFIETVSSSFAKSNQL